MRRVIACVLLMCGVLCAAAHGPIQLQIATTPSNCGQNDGRIVVTPSGGTSPYSFSFDNGPYKYSGVYFTSGPSSHTVNVKDAAGLTAVATVSMSNNGNAVTLEMLKWSSATSCAASDASVTLEGRNGTPPYQYSMDAVNWQSSPTFIGLPYGYYYFFVKDAGGCTTSILFSTSTCLGLIVTGTNAGCAHDGVMNVVVHPLASVPPYSYSLDGTNYQSSGNFTGLASGFYNLHIKDGTGTIYYSGYYIPNVCRLTLTTDVTDESCGDHNGTISAVATSGAAPYQYSIDGNHYQGGNVFTGLSAGVYTVTVLDNSGLVQWVDATVKNFGPQVQVSATAASCVNNDGGLEMTGSDGVPPYTFSIDGAAYTSAGTFDQLGAKEYTVYIKDATGCVNKQTAVVPLNNTITADAGPDLTICRGKSIVIGAVSSGSSYTWEPATGLNDARLLQPTASPAGTTVYVLTAAQGECRKSDSVTVTVLLPPKLSAGNDTAVLAGQPVPLHAEDVSMTGLSQFAWSPALGLNNASIQDPVAILQDSITYTVTASLNGYCTATSSVTIKVFSVSDIFVPSAFTPNGDGHNDILRARPVGIRAFGYFAVYSRWNQRLFYTTDPGAGWTGSFNGKVQEPGVYVWITAGVDYQGRRVERKGTVVLVR